MDKIKMIERIKEIKEELNTFPVFDEQEELSDLKHEKTINPIKKLKYSKRIKELEKTINSKREKIIKDRNNEIAKLQKEINKIERDEKLQKYKKPAIIVGLVLIVISCLYSYINSLHKITFLGNASEYVIGDVIDVSYVTDPSNYVIDETKLDIVAYGECLTKEDNSFIATSEGKATIQIIYDGKEYGSKTINVSVVDLESIQFENINIDLNIGDTITPKLLFNPENASYKEYTLSADNNNVSISNDSIKGVKEGKTTITATTKDGLNTKCNINVKNVEVESLQLKDISLIKGDKKDISLTWIPENTTIKDYTLTIDNSAIGEVIDNKSIQGLKVGEANINVTTPNGVTASAKLTVEPLLMSSISFLCDSETIYVGQGTQTKVSYLPDSIDKKSFIYESSDKSVATVSSSGYIKGVSVGVATITVIDEFSKLERSLSIKVIKNENASQNSSSGTSKSNAGSNISSTSGGYVWIPASGDKYHSINNCGRMNPNKASYVSEQYAIEHGYGKCSKCW